MNDQKIEAVERTEEKTSKNTWTKAQSSAIDFSGKGMLLSAGAGSGKTATLTEKVCRMVCDEENGTPISRMIIVTFTRAAAGELRERIASKLSERIAENPSPFLVRQLIDLESAEISTIHSFFMRAVKPHFSALGLPPSFKIADESSISVLKQRIMADTLDGFFDSRDHDFTALADTLGSSRSEDYINEKLLDIADKMAAKGLGSETMAKWAAELEKDSTRDFFDSVFGQLLYTNTLEFAEHYEAVYGYFENEFYKESDTAKCYGSALNDDFLCVKALKGHLMQGSYEDVRQHLTSFSPRNLDKIKSATALSKGFKEMRELFKKELSELAGKYADSEYGISEVQRKSSMLCYAAAKVLSEYFSAFENEKRERGIVDYGDLEIYADKIYCNADGSPTEAALEFSKRFDCIFIDEYQDTNRIQDRVFSALSQGMKRFMVGDVKQSIYAFRGSEPSVFTAYREKWASLSPDEKNVGEDAEVTLFMNENFRSDSTVTDFVNIVSSYMFTETATPFEEGDKLVFSRITEAENYTETKTEICLVETPTKKGGKGGSANSEGSDTEGEKDISETIDCPEAEYVADRISAMISGETLGDGKLIRPSHITVLLRSTTNADKFVNAIKRRGIPVKDTATAEFFEQSEVLLVLCILNAIDNPLRDIYLAGAMKSPVFGFTVTDMINLLEFRNKSISAPLWYCIEEYLEKGTDEELLTKCAVLCEFISEFRAKAPGMSASRLLSELYDNLALYSMTDGDGAKEITSRRIRMNLTRLYEYSRQFEDDAYGGLHGFIEYLCELMEGKITSDDLNTDADAVTVMNIHKSKGLQFPVCFLCECSKRFNTKDSSADVLFDPQIGLAMKLQDPSGLVKCETPLRSTLAQKIKSNNVYEEMRVLYVAMTRAIERLVITMSFTDCDKSLEKARQNSLFSTVYRKKKATSYADLILPAAMGADSSDSFVMRRVQYSAEGFEDMTFSESAEAKSEETEKLLELYLDRLSFRYGKNYLANIPAKVTVSKLRPSLLDDDEPVSGIDAFVFDDFSKEGDSETLSKREPIMGKAAMDDDNADDLSGLENAENVGQTFEEISEVPLPAFLSERKRADAADIGTATHVFLQFADFERLRAEGISSELQRLVEKRFITKEMADLVNVSQIQAFTESELFEEIGSASEIRREFRFNVALPASDFTADEDLSALLANDGTTLTVQGVVDLVFINADGDIILVDYKTDRLTAVELCNRALAEKKLRERHHNQLVYYKLALEKMYGRTVSKVCVYSLPLGDTVDII